MITDFRFTSNFLNSHVFIIDGLTFGELQTGRQLYEDLLDLGYNEATSAAVEYRRVASSGELLQALGEIAEYARLGCKPIIHFECHGDADEGLQIGDSRDTVSWEAIEPLLRRINLASKCNLGVVMAACYGLYAITPLKIHRPTPFYFLIGPQDQVTAGTLRQEMSAFYQTLFRTGNLDAALACVPSCHPYHAERFLAVSFGKYLKRGCIGDARLKRVETVLTQLIWGGGIQNRSQMRAARKVLKQRTKADANGPAFTRYAKTFLAGRSCSFTFEQLLLWVKAGG
ncbi:hypothetical protein [Burkholderia diffusa]|uniref:Uncharacterized protein n=1 Tax=Burkholderia diffusa TaxID=488732 RepID=A0A6P2R149_9BURK|nr:hypothetical protein [Burkholderia diffusa]KAB0650288.1 hypothetical protein F7R23_24640 [Burkholderia diffusa]MBM2657017.1 hypothetical protein [Burkholderia diffusa]VWC29139.1 hypothetical protein BDI24065_06284 [Burkholderia diffusa]